MAKLLNISTRERVEQDNDVLIGGFIVIGNEPKKIVVRALGPSLSVNGVPVPDRLEDPVLELHASDGSLITMNDDWSQLDQSAISALEAKHLTPSDTRESAIVATLTPGAYTGIVRGKDNTEGIALAEAYDITEGSDAQLGNISTRGFVQIEDNVMIGGFELGQNQGDAHIVVRALGPSLVDYGIQDTLADPTLELRDAEGNLLSMNDNWPDDPVQAALITRKGLAPKNILESALAIDLPAGGYTVVVRGNNGGIGVGLVEVYNTP